ncbi:MAG: peptidase M23 [Acidobacteria bacterium]|nr:MAG: peptidase M23 [Acidobacteriota bacterium]
MSKLFHVKRNTIVILSAVIFTCLFWNFLGRQKEDIQKRGVFKPSSQTLQPAVDSEGIPQPSIELKSGVFSSEKPLFDQLVDAGMTPRMVQKVVESLKGDVDFRRVKAGVSWDLRFLDDLPCQFTLHLSPIDVFDVHDLGAKPVAIRRQIDVFTEVEYYRGEIQTSLYEAFSHVPKGIGLAVKVAEVFAWDIDFYQDPRKGDHFEFLVETAYVERGGKKEFLNYKRILCGKYFGQRDVFDAYLFEDEKGKDAYYNSKGQSLIRDVLRSPLKFVRVTSSFRGQRFHPILKKRRPHNGVDYGAPKNTPVMAVADGVVKSAGWLGRGAGKGVTIKHKGQMLTQYFHLNKVRKGIKSGKRVRQGQVIGYVGKTGLATGYHLHFGMKIKGKYVNPQKQKFQPGLPISKKRKPAFLSKVREYEQKVASFAGPISLAEIKAAP